MLLVLAAPALLAAPGFVELRRHDVDAFPGGYQAAVADLDADGRPDIVALSTRTGRVDAYLAPDWKRRPVARVDHPIDLAPRDLDGDGRPEIALASGFHFSESDRGGAIDWLESPGGAGGPWRVHAIAVDPVVHRLRWGDLDGDGRPELIHAPIFGRGSRGAQHPEPAHLWAFRLPRDPRTERWRAWPIDETLTVLHGIHVADLDHDGRDEILTASFEGVHRFDWEGEGRAARWRKTRIAPGGMPRDAEAGSPRGASEVAPGRLGSGRPFIATIEPWHGERVVVYTRESAKGPWRPRVLDEGLREGHALVVADLDADGAEEIVAGWRGGEGGIAAYDPRDGAAARWTRVPIDRGLAVEGLVVADLDRDGRPDIVAIAGRSNWLVWYENLGPRARGTGP